MLASRIGQILGTDLGSLPFRPEFGSALFRLRHLPVDDAFGDLATSIVVEALGRWEPNLNVTSVLAEAPPAGGGGFVTLVVGYRVAGLSLQARIIV